MVVHILIHKALNIALPIILHPQMVTVILISARSRIRTITIIMSFMAERVIVMLRVLFLQSLEALYGR